MGDAGDANVKAKYSATSMTTRPSNSPFIDRTPRESTDLLGRLLLGVGVPVER